MFTCLRKPLQSSSCENSTWVYSEQGRKKMPVCKTNQIAGFREFHPLTNLGKILKSYVFFMGDFNIDYRISSPISRDPKS